MDVNELRERIEKFAEMNEKGTLANERYVALAIFNQLMDALEEGIVKTAEIIDGKWQSNAWVKKGIMVGFALGNIKIWKSKDAQFADKDIFPLRLISAESGVRVVPPASGLRRGAFAGRGVVLMPPAYANVGAHIGCNTMLESLAGSCCQIGEDCHISAGAVIGGVLDPIEATPVIIGDNVLMGEGSGITQGARVGNLATLAPGVHISKATPIIDPIKGLAYTTRGTCELKEYKMGDIKIFGVGKIISEKDDSYGPEIPDGALIIPGISVGSMGLAKMTPFVAKYISDKSQRAYALEEALRH